MAVGVAMHEGQMGLWNIVLNAAFCLSVMFLSLGAVVMWWVRRPAKAGRLAAPPVAADVPLTRWVVLGAIVLSVAVPVLGITLVGVLVLDLIVLANLPILKRLVS